MRYSRQAWAAVVFLQVLLSAGFASAQAKGETPAARGDRKTENVFLVTLDGMRWQEVFGGMDAAVLADCSRVPRPREVKDKFWRETPQERRAAVMPFLWSVVAGQGQIFGDPTVHSPAKVTNQQRLSFPGYNEMLCGFADDEHILGNARKPNPNVNVLEWLSHRPGFENQVAIYGTWDRLPDILNVGRSRLPVTAAWAPIVDQPLSDAQKTLNDWQADLPRVWDDLIFDAWIERAAMEHLRRHSPRVFYVMFGETDDWGHERRYDLYLQAARHNDAFIAALWQMLQSSPKYAGKTSLVITTDHGRGDTPQDWGKHSGTVAGAENIWIAVLGPDTPALGVRENVPVTQAQVAATLAALVGEDFRAASPRSAAPLPGVIAGQ